MQKKKKIQIQNEIYSIPIKLYKNLFLGQCWKVIKEMIKKIYLVHSSINLIISLSPIHIFYDKNS